MPIACEPIGLRQVLRLAVQTAGAVHGDGVTHASPALLGTWGATHWTDAVVKLKGKDNFLPSVSVKLTIPLYTCAYNNFVEGIALKPLFPADIVTVTGTAVVPALRLKSAKAGVASVLLVAITMPEVAMVSGETPVALFAGANVTFVASIPGHAAVARSSVAAVCLLSSGHVTVTVVGGGVTVPPPPPPPHAVTNRATRRTAKTVQILPPKEAKNFLVMLTTFTFLPLGK